MKVKKNVFSSKIACGQFSLLILCSPHPNYVFYLDFLSSGDKNFCLASKQQTHMACVFV